jgi:anaerobic selenocysteine-containing dehydrogenase
MGTFERITWDEAMAEVAERFLKIERSTAARPSGLLVRGTTGPRYARFY